MRYGFYRKLNIGPESISIYRQDGRVEVPESPIKPNKALILVLGTIAGLILGCFIAVLRFFLARNS
ncbi:GNVR domain-containing protein [Pseudomonas sp. St316]|uniref:GNVR domain-containing protein n=1 Tax=Pseudomonas sp. St316 TaxID=2678257 RepID=UPI0032D56CE6